VFPSDLDWEADTYLHTADRQPPRVVNNEVVDPPAAPTSVCDRWTFHDDRLQGDASDLGCPCVVRLTSNAAQLYGSGQERSGRCKCRDPSSNVCGRHAPQGPRQAALAVGGPAQPFPRSARGPLARALSSTAIERPGMGASLCALPGGAGRTQTPTRGGFGGESARLKPSARTTWAGTATTGGRSSWSSPTMRGVGRVDGPLRRGRSHTPPGGRDDWGSGAPL
jgi:hypothetical protein